MGILQGKVFLGNKLSSWINIARLGIEPRLKDPESLVLPLDDLAEASIYYTRNHLALLSFGSDFRRL